ncbi:T9SS type A sorting domain-containing protein [Flavobacterium rhamnosiphilum]|uniref:T9SS type A sorting domain-containing protein n=1 Tax=Flavobacterium rhamnosiphilum TaxID=2541724 RepID=A0A4R5F2Q8_9FLAO|nr:Ig-like domain-containing protein [Flavobacterium rhamnosiphilum]TDE41855.1 T9SS type A sorting domain-containing protein [Flavobacterium rhamnosiphilum]
MENNTLLAFFEHLPSKIKGCFLSKNTISKLGFRIPNLSYFSPKSQNTVLTKRYSHNSLSKSCHEGLFLPFRNWATFLSICFLFFSSHIFGQFANVTPPTGGFAIDGGLRANTPIIGQGDWYPGDGGNGGSVFGINGVPATSQTSGRASGENFNGNDNVFTEGSKFNNYVSDLKWFTNSAPNKNDINNALYHIARDGNDDQWIFISGDRLSPDGTSYIDFELLQGTVDQNSNGTFTGTPAAGKTNGGGRTENDIVISMEYSSGGTKPNVFIYQWKESVIKGKLVWSYIQVPSTSDLLANAFAETNRTDPELDVPYLAFGLNTYQQFAFVEAGVNISYLLALAGESCSGLNIKTLWVKTKASDSSTAALKDFITPIPVDLDFGSTEITPIAATCADNSTPQLLSAKPPGGTFSGPGVSLNSIDGKYYFTPSIAGASTSDEPHEIFYESVDGSCTGSIDIIVHALPTITGTLSVCVGSTTTLSGSPTPASSNAWASATPLVATVTNAGVVTGVSAGTSVITYTNSDGCRNTVTVTVNALPTITGTLSVCVGLTRQLTGSGSPASSNPWVSATSNVATVSNTGLVTGVSAGTSVITYTDINGCQKTALVTVNASPEIKLKITQPTLCGSSSTGSIEVCNPIPGATYTLLLAGVPQEPVINTDDEGDVIFSGLAAGSIPTVKVVTAAGCNATSTCNDEDTTDCPAPSPPPAAKTTEAVAPIESKTETAGFTTYPVPFKDQLTIRYNFDYKSDVKIEVFDSQGISVLSKTDANSYLNKEVTLDLKLNRGRDQVYVVKVTTNRGSSTKKVISSR